MRSEEAQKTSCKGFHERLDDLPLIRKHIWIDAICIDQDNLAERSGQVKIMDQIYRAADAVLIWLGPQDGYARQAFRTITILSKAPASAAKAFRLSAQLESSQYEALGMEPITPSNWYSLYALFERHWFRRAWIIQEVALAKAAVVFAAVCGFLGCPWSLLLPG
jgi:hypothetical protein